jgi:hypothetical protein
MKDESCKDTVNFNFRWCIWICFILSFFRISLYQEQQIIEFDILRTSQDVCVCVKG